MTVRVESRVKAQFFAEHVGPFGGAPHWHTWTVTLSFEDGPQIVDGRGRFTALCELCTRIEKLVSADLCSNEAMAAWFLREFPGSTRVKVIQEDSQLSAVAYP